MGEAASRQIGISNSTVQDHGGGDLAGADAVGIGIAGYGVRNVTSRSGIDPGGAVVDQQVVTGQAGVGDGLTVYLGYGRVGIVAGEVAAGGTRCPTAGSSAVHP